MITGISVHDRVDWVFTITGMRTTGLTVRCELDTNAYPKGIAVSDQEMAELNITHDPFHGEWNYTLLPNHQSIRAVKSG